jgi:hypothetical protein
MLVEEHDDNADEEDEEDKGEVEPSPREGLQTTRVLMIYIDHMSL